MNVVRSGLMFIGRVLMSLIFFLAAYHKITHWDTAISKMSEKGLPQTSILLFLVCIIEFFGAISLVLGFRTKWGASLLAIALIPITYFFHPYWSYSGTEFQSQLIMFYKNLAILAGLFYIAACGAGEFSLDKS